MNQAEETVVNPDDSYLSMNEFLSALFGRKSEAVDTSVEKSSEQVKED